MGRLDKSDRPHLSVVITDLSGVVIRVGLKLKKECGAVVAEVRGSSSGAVGGGE